MADMLHNGSTVDLDRIVDDLMQAYRACQQTAWHCIERGEALATLERLRAIDDCAELTLTLANFVLRSSSHADDLARACAKVAGSCAEVLADVEHADAQLRTGYAACLQARHACHELLGEDEAADEDARDEAVRESFPASDPAPPPTEI